jgi:hypothetical protein
MKKNVAGQTIGAQMTNVSDGEVFTDAVTVYIDGDGVGQVLGGGVCTYKGNGFHSYAPSQAETNYDHIAFTFVGTGAITSTIQVYTTTDLWAEALPGSYAAGSAGKIVGTTLVDGIGGDGSHVHQYIVLDSVSGDGIPYVTVRATSDIAGLYEVLRATTNGAGVATFHFDAAGTYYFWCYKSPYEFTNPDSEVVS